MACLTFPYLPANHGLEVLKIDHLSASVERSADQKQEACSTIREPKKRRDGKQVRRCPDCNALGKRQYKDSTPCRNNFHTDLRKLTGKTRKNRLDSVFGGSKLEEQRAR